MNILEILLFLQIFSLLFFIFVTYYMTISEKPNWTLSSVFLVNLVYFATVRIYDLDLGDTSYLVILSSFFSVSMICSAIYKIARYQSRKNFIKSTREKNKILLEEIEKNLNDKFKVSYDARRYRTLITIQRGATLAELLYFLTSKIDGFAPLSMDVFYNELPYRYSKHIYTAGVGGIVAIYDANGKEFNFGLDHWKYIRSKSKELDATNLFDNYPKLLEYFSKESEIPQGD